MRLRMINLTLIIDLEYFKFGPSILGIYILVPKLMKIIIRSLVCSRPNLGLVISENSVWLCIYSLVLQFWKKLCFGPCFGKLSF
jgi:hypothetical protein